MQNIEDLGENSTQELYKKIGLNVSEAANMLGISKNLMSELIKYPDFPCIKFKRRIVINKKKLQEWFDNNYGTYGKY